MNWTALVPIKAMASRKSRLSSHLSPSERARLSEFMLDHVLDRLSACAQIARVLILSPAPVGSTPRVQDLGRGLNEELTHARYALGAGPLLVIHADLPLLQTDEIDGLLDAARICGRAIAPDRHRRGSNAVALADAAPVSWHFGPGSFARHRAAFPPGHAVIERRGLLLDCDTQADLMAAQEHGFDWRCGVPPPLQPSRQGAPL